MKNSLVLTTLRRTSFLDSSSISFITEAYKAADQEGRSKILQDITLQQKTDTTRDALGTAGMSMFSLGAHFTDMPGVSFFGLVIAGIFAVDLIKGHYHYKILRKMCKD